MKKRSMKECRNQVRVKKTASRLRYKRTKRRWKCWPKDQQNERLGRKGKRDDGGYKVSMSESRKQENKAR
jgi:hypothetical protein